MRVLVTGASGRVGRAVYVRLALEHDVVGLDRSPSSTADLVGDVGDVELLGRILPTVDGVVHTAALHAPQVGLVPEREFERTNVEATQSLGRLAAESGVSRIVLTSTTALYGDAIAPETGAVWVDEDLEPRPRTIYHSTKLAAERALEVLAEQSGMAVTVLRMSRCFPEPAPVMAVQRLHRGVDARDVAEAHARALHQDEAGFQRYVISGETPFRREDLGRLLDDAPSVLRLRAPDLAEAFAARGWALPASIDRVYCPGRAMRRLSWSPRFGHREVLAMLDARSPEVLPPRRRREQAPAPRSDDAPLQVVQFAAPGPPQASSPMNAVYREYDRDALEWQYDARAQARDAEAAIERIAARSREARERARAVLDLAYGPTPRERLDLFLPEGSGPWPVHAFIHGGYWRSREKELFALVAPPLAAAGACVALLEYDLCPAVTIEDIVRQMRAACLWLARNVEDHGGDPQRMHVSGHSAGGHLAAMMAATDWPALDPDLPEDLIKSTTALSGLYDLEPLRLHSLNDDLRLDEAAARRLSPVHMAPTTPGPVALFVGALESDEFRRQSRELAGRWRGTGADVECTVVEGCDHFTILEGLADPDFVVTRTVLERMGLG